MTEQVGQLDLRIEAGSDAEADELAALAGQLRELLLTREVESAEPATAEPAAPGSRSGGMFLAGALTVVLTQSPELLSHLVELVQSWVSRDPVAHCADHGRRHRAGDHRNQQERPGTIFPRTGSFVFRGPALDAGVRLAIKDIDEAHAIPGIAVTLDATNQRDEGKPSSDTASQSADALLANGVDSIIGPETSPASAKVIDKITCAGVIMFSPGIPRQCSLRIPPTAGISALRRPAPWRATRSAISSPATATGHSCCYRATTSSATPCARRPTEGDARALPTA